MQRQKQDISNIFQGLLSTHSAVFRDTAGPTRFLRVPRSELTFTHGMN